MSYLIVLESLTAVLLLLVYQLHNTVAYQLHTVVVVVYSKQLYYGQLYERMQVPLQKGQNGQHKDEG